MAVFRQGFSRQNLKRRRSGAVLLRDEPVFRLAMLAELPPPMPPAAAAWLKGVGLMSFTRGCR